jgi:hypothetical protein
VSGGRRLELLLGLHFKFFKRIGKHLIPLCMPIVPIMGGLSAHSAYYISAMDPVWVSFS